ncbi:unnamed protein product [Trichogramma brassicae]|uniref:Uncharacterized protein n=1 Tax=Trichogramma brassicae TaxID=86971 RepID=A0A6H5IUB6_9HYME|nr:unnamed protein product [Trichogramma brassicae]
MKSRHRHYTARTRIHARDSTPIISSGVNNIACSRARCLAYKERQTGCSAHRITAMGSCFSRCGVSRKVKLIKEVANCRLKIKTLLMRAWADLTPVLYVYRKHADPRLLVEFQVTGLTINSTLLHVRDRCIITFSDERYTLYIVSDWMCLFFLRRYTALYNTWSDECSSSSSSSRSRSSRSSSDGEAGMGHTSWRSQVANWISSLKANALTTREFRVGRTSRLYRCTSPPPKTRHLEHLLQHTIIPLFSLPRTRCLPYAEHVFSYHTGSISVVLTIVSALFMPAPL